MLCRFLTCVALMFSISLAGCSSRTSRIEVDGGTRTYVLHVPKGYSANTAALPLVLALHPFLTTASIMADMTDWNDLADREGFFVAYPNGRWWRWNSDGSSSTDDPKFIDALINRLSKEYKIDQSRIYATGASAGGMMVQRLACLSDRFAAIAPVMSSIQSSVAEQCGDGSPIPVIIFHGLQDGIVPYDGGLAGGPPDAPMHFLSAPGAAAFWAERNGCESAEPELEYLPNTGSRVERMHFSCRGGAPVTLYSLSEAGHTWPGHNNIAPQFIVGGTSMDIDATKVIWEFFRTFRFSMHGDS
ncbi:MAG: hypothetical protein CMG46_04380 [Candidatus Marinimicrobia bacterium]|nr:hypothetical protein [Candidatus Neomarinimicrobiota bacterium]